MGKKKFYFLNSTIIDKTKHTSYVLDSNVVVGLSKLYYNRLSDQDEIDSYISLYEFLKDKDVVPGIGIGELTWDYEQNRIDINKRNNLIKSMEYLFIENDFSNRNLPRNDYSKMIFTNLYDNVEANKLLLPSLCLIKKFANLYKLNISKKEIFNLLIEFINNEHKMVLSYELLLITYFLFSTNKQLKEKFRALFKINSRDLQDKNIWNGCWDIFFLRMINEFPSRHSEGNSIQGVYNVCLVTSDVALKDFTSTVLDENKKSSIHDINIIIPCVDLAADEFKLDDFDFIESNYNLLKSSQIDRVNYLKNIDILKHYSDLLKSLY